MRSRLTILSSVKPLGDDFYSDCQINAIRSWRAISADIVLFNNLDDTLKRPIERPYSMVTASSNPPTIKEILDWYSPDKGRADEGVVAIVNSDISLTSDASGIAKLGDSMGRIWAATSFRHETHEGKVIGVVDEGLDIFCMSKTMANRMAQDIPPFLTLGRGLWDNWVNGWLRRNLPPQRYFDITDWECVLHPRHDREAGRLSNYTEEQTKQVLDHPKIAKGGIPKTRYLKQT